MNEWCPHCGAAIYLANVDQASVPVDKDPVGFEAVGLVAYNPATGGGIVLAGGQLGKVPRWKQLGATLHRRHAVTCPAGAGRREGPPGQLDLESGAVA